MATNGFLTFAMSDGAQVMPQETYALKAPLGVTPGIADFEFANKTWRQSALASAVLGAVIATDEGAYKGVDALDTQASSVLRASLLTALSTIVPGRMPDKSIQGVKLADQSVDSRILKDRSVTSQKLATPLDLKVGGVSLQLKGYTSAELAQVVLADRELAINTETYGLYAGDGKTKGGHLVGGSVAQEVEEIKQILTMLTQAVAKVGGEQVSIGG